MACRRAAAWNSTANASTSQRLCHLSALVLFRRQHVFATSAQQSATSRLTAKRLDADRNMPLRR
eukprot:CAMPEP_0172863990 /NCGR_PEP_ID=MMETSP1075-20121228/78997_1 /TAXON_ID=2916 /ORGANISM="Ceratium fusus, Strain PA161109" /LENGTH=63 /DNA_ID=CAMNT_0013712759 /DNA_START=8 /DNA_END=196 /DNA_ORIENTATION=-